MRICRSLATLLLAVAPAFAQSDRGIITGTVADPGGAVVNAAALEARNVETGLIYQVASSETGNYTFPQLPAGTYELSVVVPGFKKYIRQNLTVGVAQTMRVDVVLEIGASAESVSVTDAAPLLKTESGELSHNVETKRLVDLPVLQFAGANVGSGAIRSPLSSAQTIPGATQSNSIVMINGAPGNSQSIRIDGQETTNNYIPFTAASTQPSVDAIQEVSIQTSNFAAEYGQVGGGLFNFTMKSGTNTFHGTAYDYYRNEALEAGSAWTNDGTGHHIRPVDRANNYGFSVGGPVWLPKLYNGHDKTFFFFNLDQFTQNVVVNNLAVTVPTDAYRSGNFASILTGRQLNTDPLGRPILENAIYDPATQRLAPNGAAVRDVFPGNIIPMTRFDPIAVEIQGMIPQPQTSNPINNAVFPFQNPTDISIPSLKVDQSLGPKHKLSFFWTRLTLNEPRAPSTATQNEGLPLPITSGRTNSNASYNIRLNYDFSITPSLLLHLGAGYQTYSGWDQALSVPYDAGKELGISGIPYVRQFPKFTGISSASFGGMADMGPGTQATNTFLRPSATASLTWVKSNHSYRFGGEFRTEGTFREDYTSTAGTFGFSANETGLPSTLGQNLVGGTVGFAYASYLLGDVDSLTAAMPSRPRIGKHLLGLYAQDSWKITRRLTLDYGLRYDYESYDKEQYGRLPAFTAKAPDPLFGGRLGSLIYEGSGPGRCSCAFAKNYPLAFGPRLGLAYQITPKTVFRGGFGVVYSATNIGGASTALGLAATNSSLASGSAGVDQPVATLAGGIPLKPVWPNLSPSLYGFGSAPTVIDQNAGRPARQMSWSVGLQRQIRKTLVAEASYVGNRGAWWQANGLVQTNGVGIAQVAAAGLNITNAADRTLLTSLVGSTLATSRGFGLTYAGYPTTQTVLQSLRPFPQFGNIAALWAPLGDTWYDSLQAKATQRLDHGLDFTYALTWSKSQTLGSVCEQCLPGGAVVVVTDPYNRQINKELSGYSQPLVSTIAANYTSPRLNGNRILSEAVRGWLVGVFLNYSSGLPIRVPSAQNGLASQLLGVTVNSSRVPGVPLFNQDLNCHCYDPGQVFVLNSKAWTDPPAGTFGTAASYYNDYRYQRVPQENAALSRTISFTERYRLLLRFEVNNVFNRLRVPNPTATNALATQTRNASGVTLSGFGRIDTISAGTGQRTAQLLARFTF